MAAANSATKRMNTHYYALAVLGVLLGGAFLLAIPSLVMSSINTHKLLNLDDYYDVCSSYGWKPTLTSGTLTTISVTSGSYRSCAQTVDGRASFVATTVGGANDFSFDLPKGSTNFVLGTPAVGYCSSASGLSPAMLVDANTVSCTVSGTGANETVGIFVTYELS